MFDVADTERRENGRDPVLWQYRDKYEGTITSHLDECFKVLTALPRARTVSRVSNSLIQAKSSGVK